MIRAIYLEGRSIMIAVDNSDSDKLYRLLVAVDHRQTAEVFLSDEINVTCHAREEVQLFELNKQDNKEFTYEEISDLIDNIEKIIEPEGHDTYLAILRDAAVVLQHKNKIFIKSIVDNNAIPCYCITVSHDIFRIKSLRPDDQLGTYFTNIKKTGKSLGDFNVSAKAGVVEIYGYTKNVNTFVQRMADMLKHRMLRSADSITVSALSRQISCLILHDIVTQELAALENLISCDNLHHMAQHGLAVLPTIKVLKALKKNPEVLDLDPGSMLIIRDVFASVGAFADVPLIIVRSVERLKACLPEDVANNIKFGEDCLD